MAIYSDSQVSLKAICSPEIEPRMVQDCLGALTKLNIQNKVTLAWGSDYEEYQSNEKAEKLAREDSDKVWRGPGPFCEVFMVFCKAFIK